LGKFPPNRSAIGSPLKGSHASSRLRRVGRALERRPPSRLARFARSLGRLPGADCPGNFHFCDMFLACARFYPHWDSRWPSPHGRLIPPRSPRARTEAGWFTTKATTSR
jgi:hypothetical protein